MAGIVIADDSVFSRKIIRDIVERIGHTIVGEAPDGEVAIKIYKEKNPDLIILDITMPNVEGLSALKEIMEFDNDANVIICSALGKADMVRDAILMGAKEYIVKPIDERKVIFALQEILSKKKSG